MGSQRMTSARSVGSLSYLHFSIPYSSSTYAEKMMEETPTELVQEYCTPLCCLVFNDPRDVGAAFRWTAQSLPNDSRTTSHLRAYGRDGGTTDRLDHQEEPRLARGRTHVQHRTSCSSVRILRIRTSTRGSGRFHVSPRQSRRSTS
jgi:hypothetical protein